MGLLVFVVAFLFVLGAALLLLMSAKLPKIPYHVKSQPYEDDEEDDWH